MANTLRLLIFLLFLAPALWAQVAAPGAAQTQSIAIVNATLHLGNGQVVENGTITFAAGKITYAGAANGANTEGHQVIDATGKHVYPGLILPNSTIGLEEISAVNATRDDREVGDVNPNVRSLIAYNTDSELIPTLRFNGILLAQPTPQGGVVSGTSSIVQLDAWNWEDAAYRADDGIHLNWPASFLRPRWWLGETNMRPNPKYNETIATIEDLMRQAKAYTAQQNATTNLKLEAMKGLFDGSKTLYIHVDKAKSIVAACRAAKKEGVKRIVVVGGDDAWLVADFLKEAAIPVILSNLHRLPNREEEAVDQPFRGPALLKAAGVKFCIGFGNGMISTTRNLPFFAGTAVAYGLSKEEALQAITSDAAEILGIADRTGMLVVGLDANIVISNGDLFDMRGNSIAQAFIQGRSVTLSNKQQVLYQKYKEKYGQD